jgi:hypothetical protein
MACSKKTRIKGIKVSNPGRWIGHCQFWNNDSNLFNVGWIKAERLMPLKEKERVFINSIDEFASKKGSLQPRVCLIFILHFKYSPLVNPRIPILSPFDQ